MGRFDALFGKTEKPISDPDRQRDELSAARAGDARRLEPVGGRRRLGGRPGTDSHLAGRAWVLWGGRRWLPSGFSSR